MWRPTWRTPIVCPKRNTRLRIEKRQWRRISLPILISVVVLLIVEISGKHFLRKDEFLVVFSLAYGVFIITGIWWLRTVLTKLRFEHQVEN